MCLHARVAGPVDDHRLACLVYIVLHAKVGRHPMDQHTVVGRHVREFLKGAERDRDRRQKWQKKNYDKMSERGKEGKKKNTYRRK